MDGTRGRTKKKVMEGGRRLVILLSYDGSVHRGWQNVGDGSSVQEAVEAAVAKVLGTTARVVVHGSGRTDAGVHALGQTAQFGIPEDWRMDEASWVRALNVSLPLSVRVLGAWEPAGDFHVRYDAMGKHYRYVLCNHPFLPPLVVGRAGHWRWAMDREAVVAAAGVFLGEHDFSAFAAYRKDGTDGEPGTGKNVRSIWRSEVSLCGDWLYFDFEGSGFLYRMVRLMVGALLMVGKGEWSRDALCELLGCSKDAGGILRKSPYCVAGDGLYLVSVAYPSERNPTFSGGCGLPVPRCDGQGGPPVA